MFHISSGGVWCYTYDGIVPKDVAYDPSILAELGVEGEMVPEPYYAIDLHTDSFFLGVPGRRRIVGYRVVLIELLLALWLLWSLFLCRGT